MKTNERIKKKLLLGIRYYRRLNSKTKTIKSASVVVKTSLIRSD